MKDLSSISLACPPQIQTSKNQQLHDIPNTNHTYQNHKNNTHRKITQHNVPIHKSNARTLQTFNKQQTHSSNTPTSIKHKHRQRLIGLKSTCRPGLTRSSLFAHSVLVSNRNRALMSAFMCLNECLYVIATSPPFQISVLLRRRPD